jgi:hypothetical protein
LAYENITINYPNFCLGPQSGTFCTIDTSNVTTTMKIVNSTGGIISNFVLSSNIINEVKSIIYVGPNNLSSIRDGLVFFTLEKVSTTSCLIKRWETSVSSLSLNLKQQFAKSSDVTYKYNVTTMAIENYDRTFSSDHQGGINYININSNNKITSATKLFLGPSTDTDNLGAIEIVTVSHMDGNKIYLNSNTNYQYVSGNPINFYNYLYVYSSLGLNGDITKGTLYKFNAYDGALDGVDVKGIYSGISTSRWDKSSDSIASVYKTNMLFVKPYDSYLNFRSMFLNNSSRYGLEIQEIFDIDFDGINIYKLKNSTFRRDDAGNFTTYSWSKYNHEQDTLLPYSNSVELYSDKSIVIGQNDTTDIDVIVRDQYGVGLLNVNVTLQKSGGDVGAYFTPLNGQGVTDSNGRLTIGYTSGTSYTGNTIINVMVNGSSLYTGSQYVWNSTNILSKISLYNTSSLSQKSITFSIGSSIIKQINLLGSSNCSVFCKSKFDSPGGDWFGTSAPTFYIPPQTSETIFDDGDTSLKPMPNRITQVRNFDSSSLTRQFLNFNNVANIVPNIGIISKVDDWKLQISQLKLSTHTYWVSGVAYSELWTYVNVNQFIFVEDAIPKFWSEKNPTNTNIWIRLRPFAYSLNGSRLKFLVQEISYDGNTGFVDVTSYVTITYFDAGGGIEGVELLYNPVNDFHYNSLVNVYIEIYDTASTPNFIYVDYWFMIIPDYRFPYIENLNPNREQTNVSVDTNIYFEIKDQGAGVDIDSLEMTVNSRRVWPSVNKINNNFYEVTYNPDKDFIFDKDISVSVIVSDLSENTNTLNDRYVFYTSKSSGIYFTEFNPDKCFPIADRYSDLELLALSDNNGIDKSTIMVQLAGKDITDKMNIIPVIYRIS